MKLTLILRISTVVILSSLYSPVKCACGKQQSAHQLIYGGHSVSEGEWPWVVSLFDKKKDDFFCSANLVSHQHLLTSAHCIYEKQSLGSKAASDIYAYIGRFDITPFLNEPKSIKSDIKQIILHPNWNPQDIRFDADIAILILSSPISFSDVIQPVCLPNPIYKPFNSTGIVVGYGKSEQPETHETKPRKVKISSISNEDCFFADYNFAKFASPRTFCAGEKGKTPCRGDSGSGYFVSQGSSFQLTGIVSASVIQDCGQNDFVLFTNVAKFTNWVSYEVKKTVNKNSFDSVFDSFDVRTENDESPKLVNAACTFKNSGTSYGCYIDDLTAPDSKIALNINGGTHESGRTSRDVSVMHMKDGKVTHFPDLTKVLVIFPNLEGFGITFTKLKYIDRSELRNLGNLKFFLISDNEIEYIPPDTFLDLRNLELLDICRNKVTNLEATWLTSMPKLRVFKARSNKFTYVPVGMFNSNAQLEEILLDFNEIQRIDTDFMDLKNLKNLNTVAILSNPCVSLKYCKIQDEEKCVTSIEQFSYTLYQSCGTSSG